MLLILQIHSLVRWIIVVVMVIAIVKYAIGMVQDSSYTKLDRQLLMGFGGLMILQLLLGVILAISNFQTYLFEHFVPMLLVIGLAMPAIKRGRNASSNKATHRIHLIYMVISAILIVLAVMSLPGGWARNALLS